MKLLKCEVCGNVVDVVVDKGVPLVCCGRVMNEMIASELDGAIEKHKPLIQVEGRMLKVDVGEIMHPMSKEHLITNIWVVMGNRVERYDLNERMSARVVVDLKDYHGKVEVKEYCNLHGLWKSEIQV